MDGLQNNEYCKLLPVVYGTVTEARVTASCVLITPLMCELLGVLLFPPSCTISFLLKIMVQFVSYQKVS
jgi:hypothetical protein